ncbi:MAG: tyrosine-type recombinase/integrase [Gemmataceae bacterium]
MLKYDPAGQPVEASWTDRKGQSRKAPITVGKDGTLKVVFQSSRYVIEFTGPDGKRRSTKGYRDRQSTRQKASQLERAIERKEVGLIDPYEEHSRRPLSGHLEDYENYLRALNVKAQYRTMKIGRIRAVLAGTRAIMIRDIDPGKVTAFLDGLAADKPVPELPPEPEWISFREATRLAGISRQSLGTRVAKDGLRATGNGKARRIHRDALLSILASQSRGVGPETYNQYVAAIRSFCLWLANNDRVAVNPLRQVRRKRGVAADQRHARAPLSVTELQHLLAATKSSKRTFRGLDGEARCMLYATAARTGLRASALASLRVSSFDLVGEVPTVFLQARAAKSGRDKRQPLPGDLAGLLTDWLRGKPASALLWPGSWARDKLGGKMLRRDLAAAGIPYKSEAGGQVVHRDFHALKHHYVSEVSRASGDDRTTRVLADHTSSEITKRYDHRELGELARKVNALPPLLPVAGQEEEVDRKQAFLVAFQCLPSVPFDALPICF